MKKLIKYFKKWNYWRKRNMNGRFYKFFVLIKLAKSPTFAAIRNHEDYAKTIVESIGE